MAMAKSLSECGSDEVRGGVVDICSYCAAKGKLQPAIYFCFDCSAYGRYICGLCRENHDNFVNNHAVENINQASNRRKCNGIGCAKEHESLAKMTRLYEESKTQIGDLTSQISAKDMYIKEQEQETKNVALRYNSLQRDLEQKVKDANERADRSKNSLKDQYKWHIEAGEYKKKTDAKVSQLIEDGNKKQETIDKLQPECDRLQTENSSLIQDIEKLKLKLQQRKEKSFEELKDAFEKLQEMEKERNEFRDILSKIPEQRLVETNADIADLSDPNRMMLSHRFGQIYDDDWTDAYQALKDRKMKPKDAIMVLMELLKKCYTKCEEVAALQLEDLKVPLIQPVRFVEEVSKVRAGIKEKPRISTKHEKILKDARRQMGEASVGTVTQLMMAELKDWLKKDVGPKAFEDTKVYIEKCAETCWLSVLHDPPIYLKTDTKEGEKLDINLYTAYSASGEKIDYLVWPPLFNGKEGGLLAKGVAEPLRTVKKYPKK